MFFQQNPISTCNSSNPFLQCNIIMTRHNLPNFICAFVITPAAFHKNSISSWCCSKITDAIASLYAEDLKFLTSTYISFLLFFTGIPFHCSSLRCASKTASQKASAIGFLLHIKSKSCDSVTKERVAYSLKEIKE